MSYLKEYLKKFKTFNEFENSLLKYDLKMDKSDDLCLIRYRKRSRKDKLEYYLRNLIIDMNSLKIVHLGLKGSTKVEKFMEEVKWGDCVIENSIDGTLINLFWHKNKWKISTKSRLNADCKWNGVNIGDLFKKMINIEECNFDKNYCYSFIMCHPAIRNVTSYKGPKLYHIMSRNLEDLVEYDIDLDVEKPNIIKLDEWNKLNNINNYGELLVSLKDINWKYEGYMLFNKNRSYRVKLIGLEHIRVKELKGNYNDILFRLLELEDYDELLKYYPEYEKELKYLDKTNLIKNIEKYSKKNILIPKIYRKCIIEYRMSNKNINTFLKNIDRSYLVCLLRDSNHH